MITRYRRVLLPLSLLLCPAILFSLFINPAATQTTIHPNQIRAGAFPSGTFTFPGTLTASGTLSVTGTGAFTGTNTFTKLNNRIFVIPSDPTFPCTSAGFNAALAALPTGGSTPGGTVDATACQGSTTLNATVSIGTATVPMTLILGSGTYTCVMASGNCFVLGGSGSHLYGQADLNTYINCTNAFTSTQDLIHAEPLGAALAINTIEIDHFRIDQTNCPSSKGINMLSVRDPSSVHHITDYFYLGNVVNVDTSSIANAILSEGIHFSDIFMQSGTGTLTASTVTLKGDELYWGPSNKTVNNGATAGNFSPITISPSAVTNQAEGRRTHVFDSSVACNSATTVGILITGAAGATTGAQGNTLGPQINFELCTTGWKLTGPDASHKATNNWVFGNIYLPSTTNLGNVDFGNANVIREITNGNAGDVTLTANSTVNDVDLLLTGSTSDLSNSGTNNITHLKFLSTGNPSHLFNGQLAPGQVLLGNFIEQGPTTGAITHSWPASITPYTVTEPGVAAQGIKIGTLSGSTITQGFSGDANHSAVVTTGSGTSIGSTSLCSSANCPVGTYRVNAYIDITTACATTGTYIVNLIYTDDQAAKTVPINIQGTGTTPATGSLALNAVANFGQASQIIRSTGAASINYSTTATACGSGGPMVGKLYLSVEPLQ